MIVLSTMTVLITNTLFIIILNKESYKEWIKPQPRIILTALAINDLANGLVVLGLGLFPAIFECWPFGELLCQIQVQYSQLVLGRDPKSPKARTLAIKPDKPEPEKLVN